MFFFGWTHVRKYIKNGSQNKLRATISYLFEVNYFSELFFHFNRATNRLCERGIWLLACLQCCNGIFNILSLYF